MAATTADLLQLASTSEHNNQFVREGLWYVAAFSSLDPRFETETAFQKRLVNLMLYATFLDLIDRDRSQDWPEDASLFQTDGPSVRALNHVANFGVDGGPINILLRRAPALQDGWQGNYDAIRFDLHRAGESLLFERSDVPIGELTSDWQMTERKSIEHGDDTIPVEAIEFHFPLNTLTLLIVASKACLCHTLLREDVAIRRFPMIVIANAFYHAGRTFVHEPGLSHAAGIAPFFFDMAIRSLEEVPVEDGKLLTADKLRSRHGSMNFVARRWDAAADAYAGALDNSHNSDFTCYVHTRRTLCLVAVDESAHDEFDAAVRAAERDRNNSTWMKFKLGTLYHALENDVLPSSNSVVANTLNRWRRQGVTSELRHDVILEVLEELATIGRNDALMKVLISEIDRLREQDGQASRAQEWTSPRMVCAQTRA